MEEGKNSGFRRLLATGGKHPYLHAWWPPGPNLGYEHSFPHTVADLLLAMMGRPQPLPSFADGAANRRVLPAIERSSPSRRWESVSPSPAHTSAPR